jgi:hypothetical protein
MPNTFAKAVGAAVISAETDLRRPRRGERRRDPDKWDAELGRTFVPLGFESRPTVDTAAAAHYLHKAQQTLRIWACRENGPIRPIRVGAHLHWRTADIRRLLGVEA